MDRWNRTGIPDALLSRLPAGTDPKTAIGPNGLFDDLKTARAERALKAETDHLLAPGKVANSRSGHGRKPVVTGAGKTGPRHLYNRLLSRRASAQSSLVLPFEFEEPPPPRLAIAHREIFRARAFRACGILISLRVGR